MQDNQYKEVLIVVIACITLFLILAAIIVRFLFMYQRRRLLQEKELEELRQELAEQSLKAQLEIQEQTFLAISQEIHDNVGQILSLAKVQVNILKETDQMNMAMLENVRENIGKAMTDLRDLARSLSTERVQSEVLPEVLEQEIRRINKGGAMKVELSVVGKVRELGSQKQLILFRIVQECIQNCIKHSEAATVAIRVNYLTDHLAVSVTDDGKGFDPEANLPGNTGLGLGNIRRRIRLTGGTSQIESELHQGTSVTLKIPYE